MEGCGESRVWVEFPQLQLCWAKYDAPAKAYDRVSLLDVSRCEFQPFAHEACEDDGEQWTRLDVFADNPVGARDGPPVSIAAPKDGPVLSIAGRTGAVQDFGEALRQLMTSRDVEGQRGLEFIQKKLFQYLWKHQGTTRSAEEYYE